MKKSRKEPPPNIKIIRKINQDFAREKKLKRWTQALYFSTLSGISFGLIGLDMCGLAYFAIVENVRLINRIGTWLIVFAFPLIMFGAHCLDKIEDVKKKTQNIR